MFKYRKGLFRSLLIGLMFFSSFAEATVPNAPGSYVGVSKLSNTSVRISARDNSDNEDKFYVYVHPHDAVQLAVFPPITKIIVEVNSSNEGYMYANIKGLVCDETYDVFIMAKNSDGYSNPTPEFTFNIESTFNTTCPRSKPLAPGSYIGVTDINETSVRVNFLDNTDNEDGFLLFDESGDINVTLPKNSATAPSQTYVTLTGLMCDKTYIIRALAFNGSGNSATSDARNFNIKTTFGVSCDNPLPDITKPVITLLGNPIETLTVGDTYTDAGATATDNEDGNITSNIQVTGLPIDSSSEGNHTITYSVSDTAGNVADMVTRRVTVNMVALGKLQGQVVDLSGNPIGGAVVKVDTKEKVTDANGSFYFDDLTVSQRSVLLASLQGYLTNSRIIRVNDSVEARVTIVLTKVDISRSFDSSFGVTVSQSDGASIVLPPNIYVDREGNRYDGDVNLSLNYYPITTQNGRDLFPGNFDAINQDNERGTLQSYGFVLIGLEDSSGNPLDINGTNGTATISIPADSSLGTPLATIPLWYYDENRGIWIEDGEATYNASTGRYEGKITRIATYNLDVFSNPANLKVCVEDTNGTKVSNAYVQLKNETMTWYANVGPTSQDGYINILGVLGETDLNVSAYTLDGKYGTYNRNPINLASGQNSELDSCIVIDDGNSSLTGVVEDIRTNRKLEDVNVVLKLNGQVISERKTDNNGTYSFDKLSNGLLYSLEYTKENYQSLSYTNIEVDANQLKYLEVVKMTQKGAIVVGIVSGTITNALNGVGIDNATLKIREGTNNRNGVIVARTQTSSSGEYSITLSPNTYTVEVVKDGFIISYFTIVSISSETTSNQNFSISPVVAEGDTRIVITWGVSPSDLDSHLVRKTDGSTDYHIYYHSPEGIDANLDHDDTSSYGPETITINNPNANSVYTYYVHNFSGENELKSSAAKVNVAFNNVQRTFNVPNEDGIYWKVFEIVNNVIIPCSSNCIQNSVNSNIVR